MSDPGWPFNRNAAGAALGLISMYVGAKAGLNEMLIVGGWMTFCSGVDQVCLTIRQFREAEAEANNHSKTLQPGKLPSEIK